MSGQNVEIDMAALSEAQRKMCVQLLAHSDIKFTQHNQQFVAQLRLDPAQLALQAPPADKKQREGGREGREGREGPGRGKKAIGRVVRMGELGKLESLHRWVEIYIYPKRLSQTALCEQVENIYERFWGEHKKKSTQIRSVCFPEWVYLNEICRQREKLKLEQQLVNLVDSLQHFLPKLPALKIFHSFLAELWPVDALFYFLVLRGLLEQVLGEKILEKNGKMRNNPYEKVVSEEEVVNFLGVLFGGGLSCCRSRNKSYEEIYQILTTRMFYDQQRRKNFIGFYDLLEQLLLEFIDADASSCDLSLSKTDLDPTPNPDSLFQDPTPLPSHYSFQLEPMEEEKAQERLKQEQQRSEAECLREAVRLRL